jgi:hypothetical protein
MQTYTVTYIVTCTCAYIGAYKTLPVLASAFADTNRYIILRMDTYMQIFRQIQEHKDTCTHKHARTQMCMHTDTTNN